MPGRAAHPDPDANLYQHTDAHQITLHRGATNVCHADQETWRGSAREAGDEHAAAAGDRTAADPASADSATADSATAAANAYVGAAAYGGTDGATSHLATLEGFSGFGIY